MYMEYGREGGENLICYSDLSPNSLILSTYLSDNGLAEIFKAPGSYSQISPAAVQVNGTNC